VYGLSLCAQVLGRFERERFQSARLVALGDELKVEGAPPSRRIARLGRWTELLDSSHHWLMRLIGPPLLYREQVVWALEAWRKQSGPFVRRWLAAVGELEALGALAGYAYEHPADPFPELAGEGACFEGEGLGHPLLPESRAVPNDVRLCGPLRLLVVSGSNMSGKSTLLRTVGINTVLAMAGAPVRARRLRLSPLALGASIRTMDSLHTGTSRFYAEIKRIRRIMDLTRGERPLLFLLDELLQGTNSHDRRIGAEAIVRRLADGGAIGLLTTHDLALADIADALGPRAANVHFEDQLADGHISFDYLLRPGVVRKSNALELMRSVGLEV
jgi:DNA mismatch repair ATPase MutS